VKDEPPHVQRERAARDDVPDRGERDRGLEKDAAIAGCQAAPLGGDDVDARPGMREDLVDAGGTEQHIERVGEHRGDLARRRAHGIPLIEDVCMMTARERSERIALGGTRHPPAPDGRPNEMKRTCPRLPQQLAEHEAVDAAEDEPLGSPRGAGDDVDIIAAQSPLANEGERRGAGAEGEG
jgi:hypothetical protein